MKLNRNNHKSVRLIFGFPYIGKIDKMLQKIKQISWIDLMVTSKQNETKPSQEKGNIDCGT